MALVTPGTTSNGTPAARERQRFFAAAAEHERIAALQPHDAAAAPRRANHQRVNGLLRHRVAAGALADEEPLRAARELQDAVVDERVVQHEIRRAQARDRLARQQPRIARAGADERHMASHASTRAEGKLGLSCCSLALCALPLRALPFAIQPVQRLEQQRRRAPPSARRRDASRRAAGALRRSTGRDRAAGRRRAPRAAAPSAPARRRWSRSRASRRRAGPRRSETRWRSPDRPRR